MQNREQLTIQFLLYFVLSTFFLNLILLLDGKMHASAHYNIQWNMKWEIKLKMIADTLRIRNDKKIDKIIGNRLEN